MGPGLFYCGIKEKSEMTKIFLADWAISGQIPAAPKGASGVAQRQSGWLLTTRSLVRSQAPEPYKALILNGLGPYLFQEEVRLNTQTEHFLRGFCIQIAACVIRESGRTLGRFLEILQKSADFSTTPRVVGRFFQQIWVNIWGLEKKIDRRP